MRSVEHLSADFVLGRHHDSDRALFSYVEDLVVQKLAQNPRGRLYYIVEDAQYPELLSTILTARVRDGHSPVEFYIRFGFFFDNNRFPTAKELRDEWQLVERSENFFDAGLITIDRLFKRYGSERLGFVWESMFLDEYSDMPEGGYKAYFEKADIEVTRKILAGEFGEGMRIFKPAEELSDQVIARREELFTQQVRQVSHEDDQVIGFVGFLGAQHLGLPMTLRREGFKVRNLFPQRGSDGAHHYSYDAILGFKRRLNPIQPATELEWYKGMLGSAFGNLLFNLRLSTGCGEFSSDQDSVMAVREVIGLFDSMKDIAKLERKIKRVGWYKAFTSL
jgi:hypothetical protein